LPKQSVAITQVSILILVDQSLEHLFASLEGR